MIKSTPGVAAKTAKQARTALVLGNGPSIDKLSVDCLDRCFVIGTNGIHLKFDEWGREVDAVVMTDPHRIASVGRSYESYQGPLYLGDFRYVCPPRRHYQTVLGRDFIPLKQRLNPNLGLIRLWGRLKVRRLYASYMLEKEDLAFDLATGLSFRGSVAGVAIQLAVALGYKRILLHGLDARYAGTGAGSYFGQLGQRNPTLLYRNYTGALRHDPRMDLEPTLVLLQVYFEQMGIELFDCTPGGALRFVPKADINELLLSDKEQL